MNNPNDPRAPKMTGIAPVTSPGKDFKLFIPEDATGISHWSKEEDDGTLTFCMHQTERSNTAIAERNHAMATHDAGWIGGRDKWGRRAGSIPFSLLYLWRSVEGWDPFRLDIPENMEKMKQKLNDRGLYKLRSAEWHV